MSAGAVPVVVGLAGQLETVRHGIDGFHFDTLDELVELTAALLADPAGRRRMSESSIRRASQFSIDAFAERLDAVLAEVEERSAAGEPA